MSALNSKTVAPKQYTHEGAPARRERPLDQLIRSVMSCLLWEDGFYENGETIANRIKSLVPQVTLREAYGVAFEARNSMKLRHVPLLIVREMARHPKKGSAAVGDNAPSWISMALNEVIQRPDELSEFLALYWAEGKCPLSKQVKLGLAKAFSKFNEYSLAKYNRDRDIKLRDVLFLCHSKPKDVGPEREKWDRWARKAYNPEHRQFVPTSGELLYGKLVHDQLETPDTWEVELSQSKDKKTSWMRLLSEQKLGDLAFLRNLRNMLAAGVPMEFIVANGLDRKWGRVLPFRFISAARQVPQMEPHLEQWMFRCLEGAPKLLGTTVLLVDVSGSMKDRLSTKSDLSRLDAAKALAMLLREVCENVLIVKFNTQGVLIPPRRGFALGDAIGAPGGGTHLGMAVQAVSQQIPHDRLLVISDEESQDAVPAPKADKAYMINVASTQNAVATEGRWLRVCGFSESIVDYILRYEAQ